MPGDQQLKDAITFAYSGSFNTGVISGAERKAERIVGMHKQERDNVEGVESDDVREMRNSFFSSSTRND